MAINSKIIFTEGQDNPRLNIIVHCITLVLLSLFLFNFSVEAKTTDMSRIVIPQFDKNGNKYRLRQDMFYETINGKKIPKVNTVYVIQYDFELDGDITVPTGCVLKFEGGSLRNGRINTNGCIIDAGLYQIFDKIEFNSVNTYNNSIEVIDNIYLNVLKEESFINKKTNTIIPSNSKVNRRYTYVISDKSSFPLISEQIVSIFLNGQEYKVAEKLSNNKYKLTYNYSQVIAVSKTTGLMVLGEVDDFSDLTFYSLMPLSYIKKSKVSNKEIHPEWFGAKGDNFNDDSFAFNSALDLAYYSDSKVVVGNGIYKIDDTLVIHTHTNLEGVVPTVEYPVKGCFSVNTDVALLVFDQYNPVGSYQLENLGFIPFSDEYTHKYVGIKIYHSQNHASISNIGFKHPHIGIEIDAIGGVQMLRCEDINVYSTEKQGCVAVAARKSLGGWFNANYFRFGCVSNSGGVRFEGGNDNILDGGAGYIESTSDYLIDLDMASSLIVMGGLYKETGHVAKLRNSSRMKIEGDSHLIGEVDCDETSYVEYASRDIQIRHNVINNKVSYNNAIIAHYRIFPRNTSLWQETINNEIIKPFERSTNYNQQQFNGSFFAKGSYKLPMENIDIGSKTIALRIISPKALSSNRKIRVLSLNAKKNRTITFSLVSWLDNTSVLYGPQNDIVSSIERGERYVFLPSVQDECRLNNIEIDDNYAFLVSDIYIIDRLSSDIIGNEKLRIIDIMNDLNSYSRDDGFIYGYNKGSSKDRPLDLTKDDEGFEYYDMTLHKLVYWAGNSSIGDNGWLDALGNYPNKK